MGEGLGLGVDRVGNGYRLGFQPSEGAEMNWVLDAFPIDDRADAGSRDGLVVGGGEEVDRLGFGGLQNCLGQGMLGAAFDGGGELEQLGCRESGLGQDFGDFRGAFGQRPGFVENQGGELVGFFENIAAANQQAAFRADAGADE